ncbi:AlpA family transcriptional regulator [Thermosporothrix hazakensis]|jgi:excisionase family DNA binding protein|uniref:AlpA family transcriptional regulator n=1 Tax=Thermosporothrix hazakensis TaxID=644383 RepID=A0A326TQL0_THEHA|nr:AlpA family transcriptional regulator [Thermosporothrix hazakensis]GCE45137.1 hypothetical protein KTH_00060 [Thermosporothrix hazakensis]
MGEILEPKEVAEMLKVNPRTVIRWAEQGKIPAFKIGDLWRFRKIALETFILEEEKRNMQSKQCSQPNREEKL